MNYNNIPRLLLFLKEIQSIENEIESWGIKIGKDKELTPLEDYSILKYVDAGCPNYLIQELTRTFYVTLEVTGEMIVEVEAYSIDEAIELISDDLCYLEVTGHPSIVSSELETNTYGARVEEI